MDSEHTPQQKATSSPLDTSLDSASLLKRQVPKAFLMALLLGGGLILVLLVHFSQAIYLSLTNFTAFVGTPYQNWFEQQKINHPLLLIPLAFGGGLFASISPCILSLLPINLSYIGTLNISSRRDAFIKASLFTLGVATVFSLFGLFTSVATAVMIEFRGYADLIIGVIILIMGLSVAGLVRLPLPQINVHLPFGGSYTVGLTFALVSSPCASPVLFSVLMIAADSGSQLISFLAMISYALGYTAIIFCASLFTGLIKQSRFLLKRAHWIIYIGSSLLILGGGYYLLNGVLWFLKN
ncbi:MAG TPA: cytochrome c biogenesis protein CcdA [Nostocaceae cyanobacterium]|nr:cytochrome c biogenesis protein CcdA [Nostocaceae cyanobacterium]